MTFNSWNMPNDKYDPPNAEQQAAIDQYAMDHGADWKLHLETDWMRGRSRWSGPYQLLHQLRNSHGPEWLAQCVESVDHLVDLEEFGEDPKQNTSDQERFADCDQCGERFHGDEAIRSYLREVERDDGEAAMMCTRCLAAEATRFCSHPDDKFGEPPKQNVGPRTRMSSEEERRRRLKRKLDHKAKLAKKHSRSTVSED